HQTHHTTPTKKTNLNIQPWTNKNILPKAEDHTSQLHPNLFSSDLFIAPVVQTCVFRSLKQFTV
ncbi:hypothetical protein OFC15_27735, partial [Escherichia coli]|nr:hypothetical protein [Escherichia coli]